MKREECIANCKRIMPENGDYTHMDNFIANSDSKEWDNACKLLTRENMNRYYINLFYLDNDFIYNN
jgi:hypothetical protein